MNAQVSRFSILLFVMSLFFTTISNAQEAKTEKEFKVSAKVLKKYVGTYSFENGIGADITFEKGKLYGAQIDSDQPAMQLFAMSKTKFLLKAMGAEIVFDVNKEGVVKGFSFFQQGQEMYGTKD
jgi:hypothetical protein